MSKYNILFPPHDQTIAFCPTLAAQLGSCERALILAQIHALLQEPDALVDSDGQSWVRGSYSEWCDTCFPMWSPHNLRKHVHWLEQRGVLLSAQLRSAKWDRTKYYRIDYAALEDGATLPKHVYPLVIDLIESEYRQNRPLALAKNDGRCVYCGEPADSVDHVLPRSKGGGHELDNLVPACRKCNTRKGSRLDWSPA